MNNMHDAIHETPGDHTRITNHSMDMQKSDR